MASISVRGLDDRVRELLRRRAARHGRSMEAEIRTILTEAVRDPATSDGLLITVLDRFGEIGGVDLDLPDRSTRVRAPDLSG